MTGLPRPDGSVPPQPPRDDVSWPAPRRRTRVIAAALAIVFALATFAVVTRVWRYGAPAPAPRGPVEVKLIAPAAR